MSFPTGISCNLPCLQKGRSTPCPNARTVKRFFDIQRLSFCRCEMLTVLTRKPLEGVAAAGLGQTRPQKQQGVTVGRVIIFPSPSSPTKAATHASFAYNNYICRCWLSYILTKTMTEHPHHLTTEALTSRYSDIFHP